MRLTLPASVPASSGLSLTSRSLSRVSVSMFATGSLPLGSPLSSRVTTRLLPLVLRSLRVDFTLLAVDMVNLVSPFLSQSWASSSSSTSMLSGSHSDAFPSLRTFTRPSSSHPVCCVARLRCNPWMEHEGIVGYLQLAAYVFLISVRLIFGRSACANFEALWASSGAPRVRNLRAGFFLRMTCRGDIEVVHFF